MNAGLLFQKLRSGGFFEPQPGWPRFSAKLLAAVTLMAIALWLAAGSEADWMHAGLHWRIAMLSMLVVLGAAVYFAALWAMGFRLRDFAKRAG